jgi:hypothetical protein
MAIPEPKGVQQVPKGDPDEGYCGRAYKAIGANLGSLKTGFRRMGNDFVAEGRSRFMTSANWLGSLGPAGGEAKDVVLRIAADQAALRGGYMVHLDRIGHYSKADREMAGKAHYTGKKSDVTTEGGKAVWQELDDMFGSILRLAQHLEWMRMDPKTQELRAITGSGRGMPTLPSSDGKKVMALAAEDRTNKNTLKASIQIVMLNHRPTMDAIKGMSDVEKDQVYAIGIGADPTEDMSEAVINAGASARRNSDWGFARMKMLHDESMRGVFNYLERQRTELPDWMLEFDPLKLMGFVDRTATMLAASRELGQDMLQWKAILQRMSAQNSPAHAELTGNFMSAQLGRPSGVQMPHTKAILQRLRDYEMARLFGLTIIGPMRNAGQPMTNIIDVPMSAIYESMKEVPPFVSWWIKSATKMREAALGSGAVTAPGANPLTEIGESGIGGAVRTLAWVHMGVIKENEIRAALIGYYGMIGNLKALFDIDANADQGAFGKLLSGVRHLAIDPAEAKVRALERAGLEPDRIEELRADFQEADAMTRGEMMEKAGGLLTQGEKDAIMRRVSRDTQFGLDFATRHIWSGQDPAFAVLFMVKQWGVRQMGFIWERVVREAAKGNGMPLSRFLLATFFLGELYNNARDLVTGQERSMLRRGLAGRYKDDDDKGMNLKAANVGADIIRNIGDGGGIALMMDVMYGWQSILGGPVGSTLLNAVRSQQHRTAASGQNLSSVLDFLDKEFVMTNQYEGLWNNITRSVEEDTPRYFEYNRWRDRSYAYLNDRDAPGFVAKAKATHSRFWAGQSRHLPTERSLTYEDSQDAITDGDVSKAAGLMEELLLTGKTTAARTSIERGIRTARDQRSPLGPVPGDERADFLRAFSADDRKEARRVDREWRRDWDKALLQAQRQERRNRSN